MRFFIDSDLPHILVDLSAYAGHDAVHADDVDLAQAPDDQIAAYARSTRRCIVTGDFDFADLRDYPPSKHHGIVVLTIPYGVGGAYIQQLFAEFLGQRSTTDLSGKLLIAEPGRIRVRS